MIPISTTADCAAWLCRRASRTSTAPPASEAEEVADLSGIGSLRGVHNAQNAMAAFAACSALGLDDETIRKGLRSFPGLAHRMEEIGRKGKVLFVNDSKATNADSDRQGAGLLQRHLLDRGRAAEGRRHRGARRILPAHPQGLSDRRGGGRFRKNARRQGRLMRSPARSTRRSRSPRATRTRPMPPSPWCCCRRPARPSTSSRISRCAATRFRKLVQGDALTNALASLMRRKPQSGEDYRGREIMVSRTERTPFAHWWWTVDRLMLAALGVLMLAGIILLLAASPPVAVKLGLDPFHFVNRQGLYLVPAHRDPARHRPISRRARCAGSRWWCSSFRS